MFWYSFKKKKKCQLPKQSAYKCKYMYKVCLWCQTKDSTDGQMELDW